ncbi:unnamed protein product [Ranitomeya imitator]|uniref:Gamma-soluble NSF attachment protein n=1 Tax=Ranitomeya imitator TaxID=111125 RepID=A0ABN9M8K9_9NEOB|nr:unnamed protein product [Ranitomeya imitator]
MTWRCGRLGNASAWPRALYWVGVWRSPLSIGSRRSHVLGAVLIGGGVLVIGALCGTYTIYSRTYVLKAYIYNAMMLFLTAVAFKNAKQYDQAKDAFLKEAESYEINKAYPFLKYNFGIGKPAVLTVKKLLTRAVFSMRQNCIYKNYVNYYNYFSVTSIISFDRAYEQAGMMLKEMQKLPEAVQLIEKASMMFLENGTPDTAAMALERAGKLIEHVNLEKAVHLYQQSASVFELVAGRRS